MSVAEALARYRDYLLETRARNSGAMRYYKRRSEEPLLGEGADWGNSYWYFEVAPKGTVTRQIEVFDNGTVLSYHPHHIDDEFGGLADQLIDHNEFAAYSISREEFENSWGTFREADAP